MFQKPQRQPGPPPDCRQQNSTYGSSAVAVCDNTTPDIPGSNLKAGIVRCLVWLYELSPDMSRTLGRLIWRALPWLREA